MSERSNPPGTRVGRGARRAKAGIDAELARLSERPGAGAVRAVRRRRVRRVDLVSGIAAAMILPAAWAAIGWAWAGMTGLLVGCVAGAGAAVALLVVVRSGRT